MVVAARPGYHLPCRMDRFNPSRIGLEIRDAEKVRPCIS
jgi:hypothetical protein